MGEPLSEDLRRRIVEAREKNEGTYEALAKRFAVGVASISRLLRLTRETGDVAPAPHGGGNPPKISAEEYPALRELVAEKPDRTVDQMCHAWKFRHGSEVSRSAMQRALHKAGMTWKKNGSGRQSSFVRVFKRNAKPSLN